MGHEHLTEKSIAVVALSVSLIGGLAVGLREDHRGEQQALAERTYIPEPRETVASASPTFSPEPSKPPLPIPTTIGVFHEQSGNGPTKSDIAAKKKIAEFFPTHVAGHGKHILRLITLSPSLQKARPYANFLFVGLAGDNCGAGIEVKTVPKHSGLLQLSPSFVGLNKHINNQQGLDNFDQLVNPSGDIIHPDTIFGKPKVFRLADENKIVESIYSDVAIGCQQVRQVLDTVKASPSPSVSPSETSSPSPSPSS